MAHAQIGHVPERMSFAKIAAMPAPHVPLKSRSPQNQKGVNPLIAVQQPQKPAIELVDDHNKNHSEAVTNDGQLSTATMENINNTIHGLSLVNQHSAVLESRRNGASRDSLEENESQLSTSSINKPQSFDTKSMASVTTFAMDDKESIRPDDSASVRAVDDDVPQIGLSRNSSFQHDTDPTAIMARPVFTPSAHVTMAARRYPTLTNPPRFGNLPISPVIEAHDINVQHSTMPAMPPDERRHSTPMLNVSPDESLLEALASSNPSNRLLLLQLEEQVLNFINERSGDILDLPPQNGFARMLTHKLADYYSLPHHMNEENNSVRIFRSGSHLLPTSLAQLAKAIPQGATQLSSTATVKIMRRAQMDPRQISAGNSTAPSSSVPSKTTSENGAETNSEEGLMSPLDGTPGRDRVKLTREEREAQYKAARERIFGDFQESVASETASMEENSITLSRSSSSSGKKKTRKHKQTKDDGFEARSAFIPSYAHMPAQFNPGYAETTYPNGFPASQSGYPQNVYASTPTQAYSTFDQGMTFSPQQPYAGMGGQQYNVADWQMMQNAQSGYFPYQTAPYSQQAQMMSQINGQYIQHPHQGMQYNPGWMMDQSQNYPGPPQGGQNFSWSGYSQPSNFRGPGTASQYNSAPAQAQTQGFAGPVPPSLVNGSFVSNKSLFNPQTRSFVPNQSNNRSGGRNNRKKNSSKHHPGSESITPLTASSASSPISKEDSLQQKYGTPASLPKKPPPSEIKLTSDGSGLPGGQAGNNIGPLVVTSGSKTIT